MGPTHHSEHTKTRSSAKKICPLRDEQLPTNLSSITSMLQTLQWPTLAEGRARIKATMMYRIVNGLIAIPPTELHTSTTTAIGHTARFSPVCQNATI